MIKDLKGREVEDQQVKGHIRRGIAFAAKWNEQHVAVHQGCQ